MLPEIEKTGGFYRPLNNPILNERVLREREGDGSRLFSKRDSLHHVSGFLRENGVVGILADQRVGKQGELVEYFGRLTRASPLPRFGMPKAGCCTRCSNSMCSRFQNSIVRYSLHTV